MVYVECPRDSWQGLRRIIPTEHKIAHIQALLAAGFRHLDLGSFMSPKAVPQMADTEDVLAALPPAAQYQADYLCIIANLRGLERAAHTQASSVSYPLAIADTFQLRNTGKTVAQSWDLIPELQALAAATHKRLVVHLSMAFGNPDQDPWSVQLVLDSIQRLRDMGIRDIALADTIGCTTPQQLGEVVRAALAQHPHERLGLHLHAESGQALTLIEPAYRAGIRWFEGALGGVGGCPFAQNTLLGNMATEEVAGYLGLPVNTNTLATLAQRALQFQAYAQQ